MFAVTRKMSSFLVFIFATLVTAFSAGNRDNHGTSVTDMRIRLEENELQCWNKYFDSKCFDDFLTNLPGKSYQSRLYRIDSNWPEDNGDSKRIEVDSSGIISNDIQISDKRSVSAINSDCDCEVKNDFKDLGHMHFPRYVITTACQDDKQKRLHSRKFWRGVQCKPVEYVLHILTPRLSSDEHDDTLVPDSLRRLWKFDRVTVATGCFCSF